MCVGVCVWGVCVCVCVCVLRARGYIKGMLGVLAFHRHPTVHSTRDALQNPISVVLL